mgnify:CR=1 FL=1|jgi:hypothetical protein
MKKLLWPLYTRAHLWGPAVFVLLIAAVVIAHVVITGSLDRGIVQARSKPLFDRESTYREVQTHLASEQGSPEQLRRFYALFPELSALPEQLARIHQAAQSEGLHLDQGDYRLVREPGAALAGYQVTLQIQGGYPAMRRFLAESLSQVPVMALEQVQFERRTVLTEQVAARIRFTIYFANS